MVMTLKKIVSLTIYIAGTVTAGLACVLLIPSALLVALAYGCFYLADRLIDIGFERHVEPGFKFTRQKCHNCAYIDACHPMPGDWWESWVNDEDANED